MDKHTRQQILSNCNAVPVEALDIAIQDGHLSLEDLKQYQLHMDKVTALQQLEDQREGILTVDPDPIVESSPLPLFVEQKPIERILNGELHAEEIDRLIKSKELSNTDLEDAGLSKSVLNSLKYFGSMASNVVFNSIEDLPAMEEGRTDVYMVGMSASGKSTMMAGLFKSIYKNGIMVSDTYNTAGNIYVEQLKRNLDYGVLPPGTARGSYNYIATSIKDNQNRTHPFNIVEVPGESYERIFREGFNPVDRSNYVGGFIDYVKNKNKKILVFVIDSLGHYKRFEDPNSFNTPDQGMVYSNIISMFQEHKILDRTDAIYFVVNKFDALKKRKYSQDNRPDVEIASDFINEEFRSLLEQAKTARENSRNKFKIKVFPFSIGEILYEKILTRFDERDPNELVKNLLEDSFVVQGGAFWKKILR